VAPKKPGKSPLVHSAEEDLLRFFFDKIWPATADYKSDWFGTLYKGGFIKINESIKLNMHLRYELQRKFAAFTTKRL